MWFLEVEGLEVPSASEARAMLRCALHCAHDAASAEGLMAVLSHPDSSAARPATAIISAIDALGDVNTLANLLSVRGACDTFWRESHSRREDIRRPARSILARAFGHSVCRKRLRVVERLKRLVGLFEQLTEQERPTHVLINAGVGGFAQDDPCGLFWQPSLLWRSSAEEPPEGILIREWFKQPRRYYCIA